MTEQEETVSISFTKEEKEQVMAWAEARGLTLSEFISVAAKENVVAHNIIAKNEEAALLREKSAAWKLWHSLWMIPAFVTFGFASFLYIGFRADVKKWKKVGITYLLLWALFIWLTGRPYANSGIFMAITILLLLFSVIVPPIHSLAVRHEYLLKCAASSGDVNYRRVSLENNSFFGNLKGSSSVKEGAFLVDSPTIVQENWQTAGKFDASIQQELSGRNSCVSSNLNTPVKNESGILPVTTAKPKTAVTDEKLVSAENEKKFSCQVSPDDADSQLELSNVSAENQPNSITNIDAVSENFNFSELADSGKVEKNSTRSVPPNDKARESIDTKVTAKKSVANFSVSDIKEAVKIAESISKSLSVKSTDKKVAHKKVEKSKEQQEAVSFLGSYGQVSDETSKIRELIKKVSQLSQAHALDAHEAAEPMRFIDAQLANSEDMFVKLIKARLLQILNKGIIEDEDRVALVKIAETYTNPISDSPIESISGLAFVLTGDFKTDGGKETIKQMIEAEGGVVKSGTSSKVSYVVVGGLGSDAWAFGNYGQKVKKALDLKCSGKVNIEVVTEKALLGYFSNTSGGALQVLKARKDRFERQWTSAKVVSRDFRGLTSGQQQVFDTVARGDNVYLTGLGGTGKSYILDVIIDWARKQGKNVIACAPTGIAALNIGGSTLHRVLSISPGETLAMHPYINVRENSPLMACDILIVDEISMCRMDLFDYLSLALKNAALRRSKTGQRPCQLIVVGDFCQLPPVLNKYEKKILDEKYGRDVRGAYAFMSDEWDTWNFKKIELVEAIRQRDSDFVAALNACRVGDTQGLRWIEEHSASIPDPKAIILCGKNAEAAQANNNKLGELRTSEKVYYATINGDVELADRPTESELRLKVGARVIALVNDSERTYMNGSLGVVKACNKNSVTVQFDNGYKGAVSTHDWEITRPSLVNGRTTAEVIGEFIQIPLKLAYAMTIHKAQGQTFEAASIYPRCWDPGQLYTALSRLTSVSGMHLAYKCADSFLITSQDVIDFNEGKPIKRE